MKGEGGQKGASDASLSQRSTLPLLVIQRAEVAVSSESVARLATPSTTVKDERMEGRASERGRWEACYPRRVRQPVTPWTLPRGQGDEPAEMQRGRNPPAPGGWPQTHKRRRKEEEMVAVRSQLIHPSASSRRGKRVSSAAGCVSHRIPGSSSSSSSGSI